MSAAMVLPTAAEAERLALLAEECGEVVRAIGKIQRHGFESFNPHRPLAGSNREQLAAEMGDVLCLIRWMQREDVSSDQVELAAYSKARTLPEWLHQQTLAPEFASATLGDVLRQVAAEVTSAEAAWPPLHSAHEAYGVLLEEVRELEECVFTKQRVRCPEEMRREAIQVAAMAVRLIRDIVDGGRVRA